MEKVRYIIFRELTDADFFNINKPRGTEPGGGGQSYIDISTANVGLDDWRTFLDGIAIERTETDGPAWEPGIKSLGVSADPQKVRIAQRRPASVAIRSQKLGTRESNRVYAWRPDRTKFPRPPDPHVRGHIENLRVYLVRLGNDEVWAGWLQAGGPKPIWESNPRLSQMFKRQDGMLTFGGEVSFDSATPDWPFRVPTPTPPSPKPAPEAAPLSLPGPDPSATPLAADVPDPSEEARIDSFFNEDEVSDTRKTSETKEAIRKIRIRDRKAVNRLKAVYGGRCQISGEALAFKMKDGRFYSEVHHLIPLGEGGADSVYNMVVLSPLYHRMLHYTKVEGLDLSKIHGNKLPIKMNGNDYEITWHPDHARIIKEALSP